MPKRNKESESTTNISQFYFCINSVFRDSKLLLQLILTYPITSNEGERSFSQLKDLLTSDHYGRAAAKQPDADGSPQISLVRNLQLISSMESRGYSN